MQTWIEAVNEQGGFGKWGFEVVLEPSRIRDMVMAHAEDTSPGIQMKNT
jgi:type III restriction enzyme